MEGLCCGPGYASPSEAIKAPKEKLLYTIAIYTGTGIQKPDYLATIDVDLDSPTYSSGASITYQVKIAIQAGTGCINRSGSDQY